MKKIITLVIEKQKDGDDIRILCPELKKAFILTYEMQLYGDEMPKKPRQFVRKGKLTPNAKAYINAIPRKEYLLNTLLQYTLNKK